MKQPAPRPTARHLVAQPVTATGIHIPAPTCTALGWTRETVVELFVFFHEAADDPHTYVHGLGLSPLDPPPATSARPAPRRQTTKATARRAA